jgi:D-arabinose 1-dehydrogenase-like Zn-dependent alcohol dehydrogenase
MAANSSPIDVLCLAAGDARCDVKPVKGLKRRSLGDLDVLIDMRYCGICHTDIAICKVRARTRQ